MEKENTPLEMEAIMKANGKITKFQALALCTLAMEEYSIQENGEMMSLMDGGLYIRILNETNNGKVMKENSKMELSKEEAK